MSRITAWTAPLVLLLAAGSPLAAAGGGREVRIEAPDGVALAATYWNPGRPGPGILLLHMCNSDRSAWNGLGEKLAARGFHALALDYRGFGQSGGVREKDPAEQQKIVTGKWPGDVDAAFAFLTAQPGVAQEPVGAAGGSCGVNQAVQLARRHPQVRSLVLLAGMTNRAGEDFLDANPWLPLLASAARDDDGMVPAMRWVLGFSTNPANRFLEYATGGHGTQLFAVHAELEPAIVDFFAEHLVRHPPLVVPAVAAGRSPSAALRDQVGAPGAALRLRQALAAAKSPAERPQLPPEGVVNLLGYTRLQDGDARGAIELFELNLAAHPESANTHDSLADGYLALGDRARAREHARGAVAALAGDPNQDAAYQKAIRAAAEEKLRQLDAPAAP